MGASHGIGYMLGAAFDIPHGHTSCIILPAVMRWNNRECRASSAGGCGYGYAGEDAGDVLDKFIGGLGMPRSLSAGQRPAGGHFEHIAEQAMHTPWVPRNPRPIGGPSQVREMLELAA